MLKLITAKSSILLPGGIIKKPGDTFMCDLAFADKLIQADSAIQIDSKTPTKKAIKDMTINELKECAEKNNILIGAELTKKDDIYNAVKAGIESNDMDN